MLEKPGTPSGSWPKGGLTGASHKVWRFTHLSCQGGLLLAEAIQGLGLFPRLCPLLADLETQGPGLGGWIPGEAGSREQAIWGPWHLVLSKPQPLPMVLGLIRQSWGYVGCLARRGRTECWRCPPGRNAGGEAETWSGGQSRWAAVAGFPLSPPNNPWRRLSRWWSSPGLEGRGGAPGRRWPFLLVQEPRNPEEQGTGGGRRWGGQVRRWLSGLQGTCPFPAPSYPSRLPPLNVVLEGTCTPSGLRLRG